MLKTEQRYHLYVNGSQCFSIKARVTAKAPLLKMEERFTNFYSTLDKYSCKIYYTQDQILAIEKTPQQ